MLKILIVDDEILVRIGIKSSIDWDEQGFQYVGDAADGEKAFELIKRTVPDIVLTDILMPNMNGLELIEKIKQCYPLIKIIVLSSHNDYEYVRNAMKLGVEDYILKTSMKPSELLTILKETAKKIALSREGLINKYAEPVQDDSRKAALIRLLLEEPLNDHRLKQVADSLQLKNRNHHYLLLLKIHHYDADKMDQASEYTFMNLAIGYMNKWMDGHILRYKENEYMVIMSSGDEDVNKTENELFILGEDTIVAVKRFLNLSISIGFSNSFGHLSGMKTAYEQAEGSLRRGSYRNEVQKLIDYMLIHYNENISLKRAAEYVNMSEGYLSFVFKKETKKNFIEFITQIRIDKAVEYLRNTDLPSYIIAEKVGYVNINYFGRIFKKVMGMNPSQYRQQFK
jgi:two-component system response regulator YesN